MMKPRQIMQVLSYTSYKGRRHPFSIDQTGLLTFSMPTRSRDDRSQCVLIQNTRNLRDRDIANPHALLTAMSVSVQSLECHEAMENLLVNGLRVFDPHIESKYHRSRVNWATRETQ